MLMALMAVVHLTAYQEFTSAIGQFGQLTLIEIDQEIISVVFSLFKWFKTGKFIVIVYLSFQVD